MARGRALVHALLDDSAAEVVGKGVRRRGADTTARRAPGEDHGVDADAQGDGVVTDHRLYQLVRQKGTITDHIFVIEFQDAGVEAFAFTFG